MGEQREPTMSEIWGPENTKILREDKENVLCLAAADAIERRDAEIERLEKSLAMGDALLRGAIDRANKAEATIAEKDAGIERLKQDSCEIYNAGYKAGHHHTVAESEIKERNDAG